jgi:hypothetical protein
MRKLFVATILVLAFAMPVRADDGLTGAVAAAYFPRTVDSGLHAIAHERVLEISACNSCMDHDGMRSGTAEVLGYNSGYSNPIAAVLQGWSGSAIHNGILSDATYGRIGCAERSVGDRHWFACVLATGGSAGQRTSGGGGVTSLPDTAMPR